MFDPISDDDLAAAAEAYAAHKSQRAAAKALGLDRGTYRYRLKVAARKGLLGFAPVLPGFEVRQTSTARDADGKVEREWIQQRPESGGIFALPEGHRVRGVSALTDPDGKVRLSWIKTWQDSAGPGLIEAARKVFAELPRARPAARPRRIERDLMSVYPIADQHVGMLAWGAETGENYDLAIGAERLRQVMARLIAQSPPSRRAIILNLGDWQHTDDQRNATPASSNQLDVDGRYFKVLVTGVQLMRDCIDLALRRHDRVLVRNIPGNHDPHASKALTIALAAHYEHDRRVTVDIDPGDFFFHRFGATLIGATHGHKVKPADMAMTMAVRCRADWAAARYHWFLCGHIHHESAREIGDVRVESFQTLAAKDAFAAGRGYSSGQSLNSITLHRRDGEIGRHRVNLVPPWCRRPSRRAAA